MPTYAQSHRPTENESEPRTFVGSGAQAVVGKRWGSSSLSNTRAQPGCMGESSNKCTSGPTDESCARWVHLQGLWVNRGDVTRRGGRPSVWAALAGRRQGSKNATQNHAMQQCQRQPLVRLIVVFAWSMDHLSELSSPEKVMFTTAVDKKAVFVAATE